MPLQLVLRLRLCLLCTGTQLAHNPLVSALNAFPNLGECSVNGVAGAVLEVRVLFTGFSPKLVESRTLGNWLAILLALTRKTKWERFLPRRNYLDMT